MKRICKRPECGNSFQANVHNQRYCTPECKREMDRQRKRSQVAQAIVDVLDADDEASAIELEEQNEYLRRENRRLENLVRKHKYKKNEDLESLYRRIEDGIARLDIKPVSKPKNLSRDRGEEVANPVLSDWQVGKALEDSTEVLTTEGWKLHGDIVPGDFVYSPDGKPVEVLAVTGSSMQECYEVKFDCDVSVVASKDHLWEGYRRYKTSGDNQYSRRSLLWTTEKIAELRRLPNVNGALQTDRAFHVDVTKPLSLPQRAELSIDPYILGYWLGDGLSSSGRVCGDLESMQFLSEYLGGAPVRGGSERSDGYREAYRVSVPGLRHKLVQIGILDSKGIPQDYLFASQEDRLALLQGLFDSDGSIDKRGIVEFSASSYPQLAFDVKFLLASLGIKASLRVSQSSLNGVRKKDRYRVVFSTHGGFDCFKLPRKRAKIRHDDVADAAKFRFIQGATPVGVRSAQCLTVEGGLYLVTRDLITTHNCTPTYNSEICRERIDIFGEKVIKLTDIQRSDHPVNVAHIHALGDIVEGEDIFVSQAYELDSSLYRQIITGVEITADFLRRMLSEFEYVKFVGVIGNHGRLNKKAGDTYNPESNMDRLVYKFTSMLFADEPRVEFHIPDGPGSRNFYAVDNIGEYSVMLIHGDQFPVPTSGHGYVKKVLGWKNSGIHEDFREVIAGHYHQNTKMTIGDVVLRIAGTPESDNHYASERLGMMGRPSQHLQFVSPSKGIVTAEYDIWLDEV